MYVLVTGDTATYYSATDLYRDNPDVSFPVPTPDSTLAEFNVYPCQSVAPPSVDYTQNLTMGPPMLDNGAWEQTWIVSAASPEEIAARRDGQWEAVRSDRNLRLSACDWTQLPDCPLSNVQQTAWATYRQALRDITAQADPFTIAWPGLPA